MQMNIEQQGVSQSQAAWVELWILVLVPRLTHRSLKPHPLHVSNPTRSTSSTALVPRFKPHPLDVRTRSTPFHLVNYALSTAAEYYYCLLNTACAKFCYLFIARRRYLLYICQSLLLNIHLNMFACVAWGKD